MTAITEETVTAGIMTFFLYGVLPTVLLVYIGGSRRRRERAEQRRLQMMQEQQNSQTTPAENRTDPAS